MNTTHSKIPVAILGATGMVGQKLLTLLHNHPLFEVTALCASSKNIGKKYCEATQWVQQTPIPQEFANTLLVDCIHPLPKSPKIVFSGLDSSVALEIEEHFASNGLFVVSNSKNHRMHENVPLIIPEINADHLGLLQHQTQWGKGRIITNPNCTTIGLAIALAPILKLSPIIGVSVVTMQALSGAGLPGVASINILDNIIPNIQDESEKIASEPLKILGKLKDNYIEFAHIPISAQTHRVSVSDGHLLHVTIKCKNSISKTELINTWSEFSREKAQEFKDCPMSPKNLIYFFDHPHYPQPKLHREWDKGMSISIGQLSESVLGDFQFNVLSHNTIRGAAGAAIFNAELLVKGKYL